MKSKGCLVSKLIAASFCLLGLFPYPMVADTQTAFQMPSLQSVTLREQFPKYRHITIESMIKYKQDLEDFRGFVLEGYNRALKQHAINVDESSKRLERLRASGKLSGEEYEGNHFLLKEELRKLGATGEYLRVYHDFLIRYQDQVRFANQQKEVLERIRRRAIYGM